MYPLKDNTSVKLALNDCIGVKKIKHTSEYIY